MNLKELYIPPPGYNFSLPENCSYKIEIKKNRHTLDIISYIPDISLVNTSNMTNTTVQSWTLYLQHIYNKTIDKIQYVFKWKDPVESYHINIYPDEIVDGCGNGTPYYVQKTTMEANVPDSYSGFQLHEGCKYIIEINVNNEKINVTNEIPGNLKVEHVLLETIYNESIHKIQYVIRWKDVAPDEYKIDIINKDPNVSYCNKYFQEVFNSSHTEILIPPTKSYDFSLRGKCKYIVELKYDEEITKILTDIPACVGPLCNCEILSPHPENIPQIENSDFNFNVSWSFSDSEVNNITDYGFFLFDNGDCNSSGKRKKINPIQLNRSFAILSKKDLTDGGCLSVSFNNSFLCTYTDTFTYLQANGTRTNFSSEPSWIYWLIGIVLLVVVVITLNYYFRSCRRNCIKTFGTSQREPENQNSTSTQPRKQEVQNLLYIEQEILYGTQDKYEFPRARIEPLREIGKGAFGEVLLATALIDNRKKYVAVKRLRANPTHEELEDFASEIAILKKIGYHQNIVRLIGCCTLEEPNMMIMEYVPCGDLKQYLLDLRNQWQKVKKSASDYSVFTSRSSAYIVPETPDSPATPQSKISASKLSVTEIRTIKSKKGVSWSCRNCNIFSSDINDLRVAILSLRNDLAAREKSSRIDDKAFKELLAELGNRNNRKQNIIMFGVPESDTHDANPRKSQELGTVQAVLSGINTDHIEVYRIGRFRRRPIRVKFSSSREAHIILKRAKRLRENEQYKHINISLDKTRRQIYYYKKIKAELDTRVAHGEDNLRIKYKQGISTITQLN
ncbi:hypothetical protein Trydic_g17560 [Trypoxylus dichotomus]